MTVAVLIGAMAMILLVVTAVAALHIIRQASADSFRALERLDARHEKSLQTVLDRLMTIKWEDFAAVKTLDDDENEETGFIAPHRDDEGEVEIEDGRWGHLSTLRERLRLTDEEDQLLREDFPEDYATEER